MFGRDYDKNHGMDNKDFPEWVVNKMHNTFYNFCLPLYSNQNLVCSKKNNLRLKYGNKDILILGGGGSTLNYLNQFDYGRWYDGVWTLNNFFLNMTLYETEMDLISLGPEVNLQNDMLQCYLNKFQPDVCIELHQKWSREEETSDIVTEVNGFYNHDKQFCFQTKYFSVLGSGVRLIILACELGAKSVSFIGFDGPDAIWNADHAFEKGKNFMTYRAQGYPQEVVRQMFKDEYDWFWNYIKTTYPAVKLVSLDKNNKYHELLH
jgi:hypothetical protein